MDLDPGWKKKTAAKFFQEEGQKEEKNYPLNLSSKNDKI